MPAAMMREKKNMRKKKEKIEKLSRINTYNHRLVGTGLKLIRFCFHKKNLEFHLKVVCLCLYQIYFKKGFFIFQ
jgi:hypothetical protein